MNRNLCLIFCSTACKAKQIWCIFLQFFQMFIFAYLLSNISPGADRYMCCLSINRGVGDADINCSKGSSHTVHMCVALHNSEIVVQRDSGMRLLSIGFSRCFKIFPDIETYNLCYSVVKTHLGLVLSI